MRTASPVIGSVELSTPLSSRPRASRPLVDEVVLLCGSVARAPLQEGLDRSPLDLPLAPQWTLLDGWREHCAALSQRSDDASLPVTVLLSRDTAEPTVRNIANTVQLRLARDPRPFRGTAGILRDVYGQADPNRRLLVATSMQILTRPLIASVRALAHLDADIAFIAHDDGTPSGLMLMRAAALRCVPDVGFCDLKEQALPAMAQEFTVRVLRQHSPTGLPVRTLKDYITGLAALHGQTEDLPWSGTPMAETWRPSFALVEEGAQVAPGAKLHDAVVLRGAVVEGDALLVRSVIGPGARIGRRQVVIDELRAASTTKH